MFQKRLKELRKNKGLSQKELAKLLNVSSGTIAMYETGKRKPDHETLLLISKFFKVSIDFLLGNDNQELSKYLPELKEFADKLNTMPKKKRDELLKVGNQLFDLIMKDINDDKKDGGNK